ncbi:MAG: hypothetical protein ABL907_02755 [Hyphomicrobium sp.]
MATIIEFRPAGRSGALPQGLTRAYAAPAEIVLFPGVRYERWAQEQSAADAKSRRKVSRKRDKLELTD